MSSVFLATDLLKDGLGESDPFQFGTVRVVPAPEPAFGQDEGLKLYVEATVPLRPEGEPVGITSEIPLRKCEPGDYVIRVRVTDELSGETAESETYFAVRAAAPETR